MSSGLLRRNARLRKEYLYRKSLEGKEAEQYEKKRKIRKALEEGKHTAAFFSFFPPASENQDNITCQTYTFIGGHADLQQSEFCVASGDDMREASERLGVEKVDDAFCQTAASG